MKRCPKCNADYFDNMLEYCLEDGTRLAMAPESAVKTAARVPAAATGGMHAPLAEHVSQETVVIPAHAKPAAARGDDRAATAANTAVIDRAAVGLALAHNWWQWLYLEKTYVYSITDYILSANFLMWLLLLGAGTAAGIYSLKRSKDKTFAVISLVALAINLILFLVPRR